MLTKRILIVAGHYGSGKTQIAVQLALMKREQSDRVVLCDLDIVNPYFRTIDAAQKMDAAGIRLIASPFAGSNVELPSMTAETNVIFEDDRVHAVLDVGGDDRGALALGRYETAVKASGSYEMLMVINRYRPITATPEGVREIQREIEAACRIPFTGLIHNSHLGRETTKQDVLNALPYAQAVARETGLPIAATCVTRSLYESLVDEIPNLLALDLFSKEDWAI